MKRLGALVLAAGMAVEAAAQPLGRVFFAPSERAQIAAARTGAADGVEAARAAAPTLQLSGVVRSGRGAVLAFIDGAPVADGAQVAGFVVRVEDSGVRLIGQGRVWSLRAGERIDLASGARTGAPRLAPERGAR